jgi:hypothetical protein
MVLGLTGRLGRSVSANCAVRGRSSEYDGGATFAHARTERSRPVLRRQMCGFPSRWRKPVDERSPDTQLTDFGLDACAAAYSRDRQKTKLKTWT